MNDIVLPASDEPLPTAEENRAGVLANAVSWDAAIRASAAYAASAADGSDDAAVAAALNALEVDGPAVSFPLSDAIAVASFSANFSWSRIVQRARGTAQLPPTSPADAAIIAAQNVTSQPRDAIINPANTPQWEAFAAGLHALVATGDLTTDERAAIEALGTTRRPWWQSIGAPGPLNEYDIHRARAGA